MLLPFLCRQDVHTFLQAVPVRDEPRHVFALWLQMKMAARPSAGTPTSPFAPMPPELGTMVARRLRRLPIVASNYFDEPQPRVEYVALASLITNQYHVDLDHVEQLRGPATEALDSPARLAAFCLPQPELPDPVLTGSRTHVQVVVEDIAHMAGLPEVRRLNRGVVELRIRLIPQGAFLTCAQADTAQGPLAVAGNGTHRMLALLQAGHTHAPVLVRTAFSAADLGLNRPTGFSPEVLTSRRPPRVADFLDPSLCGTLRAHKSLRSSRLVLDLDSEIPRPPDPPR